MHFEHYFFFAAAAVVVDRGEAKRSPALKFNSFKLNLRHESK